MRAKRDVTVAFRIDFDAWLATMDRRNRRIIDVMMTGEPGVIVAERFAISTGWVSQLRRRYEREWRAVQGEGMENLRQAA